MEVYEVIHIPAEQNKFPHEITWLVDSHVTEQSLVVFSAFPLSKELDKELLDFFSKELQVGAVEIRNGEGPAIVCPKLRGQITVFRGSILIDYFEWWSKLSKLPLSRQDFGIQLNKLGYSQYELRLLGVADQIQNEDTELLQISNKSWDGYITHVENDWNKFSHFHQESVSNQSLLLDARTLDPINNGTARVSVGFLRNLASYLQERNISTKPLLLVSKETANFFQLENLGFEIRGSLNSVRTTFDLGISVSPITTITQGAEISFQSKTWAVIHLDLIAVRSLELLSQNSELIHATGFYLETATKLYFISNSALSDCINFYPEIGPVVRDKSFINHLGVDLVKAPNQRSTHIPEGDYVLVLGNHYLHKQVERTVAELVNKGIKVVTIGGIPLISEHHTCINSSTVSDTTMFELISHCAVAVFPSMYEGFGLPILEVAAHGKPLILWDTETSREVARLIKGKSRVSFVSSMRELAQQTLIVLQMARKVNSKSAQRTMRDFSFNLCDDLFREMNSQISIESTNRRRQASYILRAVSTANSSTVEAIRALHWKSRIRKKLGTLIR